MRTIRHTDPDYRAALAEFDRRAEPSDKVHQVAVDVIAAVRERGDAAVLEFAEKFDGAKLTAADLRVTETELEAAAAQVADADKAVLAASHDNVSAFATGALRKGWSMENAQGVEVGERYYPIGRVGVYIPGGKAPLVSTAIMTCTLGKAAGCTEIVACTPCGPEGQVHPALLYALQLAGATEIYKIGGAQAVAAMAYGTDTLAPVDKVFGPGNQYVVEAKRQVFGRVAVDLLPGPSEVLVLADSTGRPDWLAADLLAQAEHGGDSEICFVTDSPELLDSVLAEIDRQAAELPRGEYIKPVLEEGAVAVLVNSIDEAIEVSNAYAPEHITLVVADEEAALARLTTAGAIYCGNFSAVAVGDFLAGPSHTLPTGGAGKAFPGLTVDQFQRKTSIVRLDQASAAASAPLVGAFARIEGLEAHARSAERRAEGSA